MNNRLTVLAAGLLAAASPLLAQEDAARAHDPLFRVLSVNGMCQAQRPTKETFEPATAKMYPFGTLLRAAANSEILIGYQNNYSFTLTGPGEVVVTAGQNGPLLKLTHTHGKLQTTTIRETKPGDVVIETPGFTTVPSPDVLMSIDTARDANNMSASSISIERGSAQISGPQFNMPMLKSCALRIQTAVDRSLTRITGGTGEFLVQLDNNEAVPMEYTMKPNAVVKISRQFAPVTGREGVAVLVINDNGVGHASYSFIPNDPVFFMTSELRKPVAPVTAEDEAGAAAEAGANNAFPAQAPAAANDDDAFSAFDLY